MNRHEARAIRVIEAAKARGLMVATVESCTGGLIAGALTDVPGSSAVVERGFVTYSDAAKTALVGVPEALIAAEGAVSEADAIAMAQGALPVAPVGAAVAVTGVAGPGGGTATKPVGRVHVAAAMTGRPTLHIRLDLGDPGRALVRALTVDAALDLLLQRIETSEAP